MPFMINTLRHYIDGFATLRVDKLRVCVRLLDARIVYGRADFAITPFAGSGTQWVSMDRLSDFVKPHSVVHTTGPAGE